MRAYSPPASSVIAPVFYTAVTGLAVVVRRSIPGQSVPAVHQRMLHVAARGKTEGNPLRADHVCSPRYAQCVAGTEADAFPDRKMVEEIVVRSGGGQSEAAKFSGNIFPGTPGALRSDFAAFEPVVGQIANVPHRLGRIGRQVAGQFLHRGARCLPESRLADRPCDSDRAQRRKKRRISRKNHNESHT